MDNINSNYEIVGIAEWFVPAIIAYHAIHGKININHKLPRDEMIQYLESKTLSMDSKKPILKGYWNHKSIRELEIVYSSVKASEMEGNIFDVKTLYQRTLKNIDLLTYSFPCQDLSNQGKQKGMSKNLGTRSGLLWEIEKALDMTDIENMPRYLVMENVMALSNKKNEPELSQWLNKLEKLGYKNDIGVLNSANFGSPQARKRVFMISTLDKKNVKLPIGRKTPKSISHILNKETKPDDFMNNLLQYQISPFKKTNSNIKKGKLLNYTSFNSEAYVYDPKFTGPTLTASGANSRIKIMFNESIRKINSEEAFKYMGFLTRDFNSAKKWDLLNDSQLIYLCGNSISVEVMNEIMKNIIDDWNEVNHEC